ncbi:hypothetical protein GOV03_02800 [Candidatus Woesearchaeota archaeon]|nr:hypothetical protein [Candidatus Woesearchaeota archaeon]
MLNKTEKKHNQAVVTLEKLVKYKYQLTFRHVEYRAIPGAEDISGELDLVGIWDAKWDIYEVKLGDSYRTARNQLLRARKILSQCGEINLFYYSAKTKKITPIN